jgi:hypothetical protein
MYHSGGDENFMAQGLEKERERERDRGKKRDTLKKNIKER